MQYYLSNSAGQLCQVSLDTHLMSLAAAASSTSTTIIPLTVHLASTKYATDMCGRSSVLCSFSTVTLAQHIDSSSASNVLCRGPNVATATAARANKSSYVIPWIATIKSSNNKELVLVWYPQLESTGDDAALVAELNTCITPAYLCHHSYAWYISDNIEEAVTWSLASLTSLSTSNNHVYNLVDESGAKIAITPSL